jgi:hypothetical protein
MKDKGKIIKKITNPPARPDLELALDVGHSSIGWAVLEGDGQMEIKGCGAVVFRADDCLASARRGYRRQRRHIRSTRQRIARMKVLLKHLGVLTGEQLKKPGCAWPWLLAARVLRGGKKLAWSELWDALAEVATQGAAGAAGLAGVIDDHGSLLRGGSNLSLNGLTWGKPWHRDGHLSNAKCGGVIGDW